MVAKCIMQTILNLAYKIIPTIQMKLLVCFKAKKGHSKSKMYL